MLIVDGTLVQDGGERIVPGGAVRIEGVRIQDIGPTDVLRARYPDDEQLSAHGMLIMPGLVCAHARPCRLLARGMLPGGSGQERWLRAHRDLWWKLEAALSYEDVRYGTLAACADAIRCGTTTLFVRHSSPRALPFALDAVAEAVLQAGLRACLGYEVTDRNTRAEGRQGVEENARFARRCRGESLLAATMGMQASYALSDETLSAAVGGAALADIGFHVDAAEDMTDQRDAQARYGMRVVERLRKRGILGPRTVVVHGLHLATEELRLLAATGTTLVHCPRSNVQYALGLAPVSGLLAAGGRVGLGCDHWAPDLLREMQAAYLAHQQGPRNAPSLMPQRFVELVLGHNAALAARVMRERVGELAIGALADLILVDYASPVPLSAAALAGHLLLGFDSACVDTSIVNGRVLMRHRELLTLDRDPIGAQTKRLAGQLMARL
ncbi:MAG: amidohydrolase family protein [Anaerolineae bacterium]